MRYVVGVLVLIFLPVMFLSFIVALMAQPWSPFLFGQRSGPVRTVPIGDLPISIPVPTVGIAPPTGRLEGIVDVAKTWIGVHYLWGGCTRAGVDCSCAVRIWLSAFAISAPRTTTEQIKWARPIPRDQAAVGDLVFYDATCSSCGADPTHVGLYIGNGQIIQAGDPVQISPAFTGYYGSHNPRVGRVP